MKIKVTLKSCLLFALNSISIHSICQNTFPSSGNVGIGTTSPSKLLHIYATGGYDQGLRITNTGTGSSDDPAVLLENGSYYSTLFLTTPTNSTAPNATGFYSNSPNGLAFIAPSLSFTRSNLSSSDFMIANSGNVGIGTTTPGNKLEVNQGKFALTSGLSTGAGGSASILISSTGNNSNSGYAELQTFYAGVGYTAPLVLERTGGNVGIGTTTPGAKLSFGINGVGSPAIHLFDAAPGGRFGMGIQSAEMQMFVANGSGGHFSWNSGGDLQPSGTNELMRLSTSGALCIGTTNPGTMKLAVEGNIGARKIIVTQTNPFPDYVFKPEYKLRSLNNLEIFIKKYNHLPDVPSAKAVEKEGLDIGSTQAALLRKIEELTLYVIELKKENNKQDLIILKQGKILRKMQKTHG